MTKPAPGGQSISVASARDCDEPDPSRPVTLDDLFQMHAGYVWNTLRRLGAGPADVEDLTHEVFLQVHARLGDFDTTRPARPWLFGFAFRVASRHRRRAHHRREIQGDPAVAR